MEKLNGRDIGANNLTGFKSWVVERDAATDWSDVRMRLTRPRHVT